MLVGTGRFDEPNVASQLPSHTFSGASLRRCFSFGVLRGSAVTSIS